MNDLWLVALPAFVGVILPATIATTLPLFLLFQSFGSNRWVGRRALVSCLVLALVGYIISLVYYGVFGVPPGASSIFNLASIGAFWGAGYGGIGAVLYFHRHSGNPRRTSHA